ncbi:MAG: peptide chain release factor 2 [Clostridia bacterium]|nr:peptide chain release factor 2 [Clostridia bacterium]
MIIELKPVLEAQGAKIEELRVSLDIARRREVIAALEEQIGAPGFWDDPAEAQKVMQKLTEEKDKVKSFEKLFGSYEDLLVLLELAEEESGDSLEGEIAKGLKDLEKQVAEKELEVLLSEPYDHNDAIVSLHAGAGGTEAQDWVEMLVRMYTRWGDRKGYKVEIMDLLPGDEAGVKSATIEIKGSNAYGYLKTEKGVHRLVRISPFDASGRRHTSFASVDVIPEVDEAIEVQIDPGDLKVDTYRASGAGGQHVNKTDSAVRITHLPTGIVVQCQNERSQISNRTKAMKILQAKLVDLQRRQQEAEINAIRGEQQDIAWGSQIRSYVFHPYSLAKDHRTNVEAGNVDGVMDGDIDGFISAYLQMQAKAR